MQIITISREFGSGGRELGKRLADKLHFAYYDTEIITEIAKQTRLSENYISTISESGFSDFAFHFGSSFSPVHNDTVLSVFIAQQNVLRTLAEKGNCVIVGRGSDVVLSDMKPLRIFVHADTESKIARCRKINPEEKMSDKDMKRQFRDIDRGRRKLHDMLSGPEWGECSSYDLCINTSGINIKDIIEPIAQYSLSWFRQTTG